MNTPATIRHLTLAALCLLGLLLCTACSSDPGSPSGSAETTAPSADQGGEPKRKKLFLAFGGGPTGGTFNFFANKISSIVTQEHDHLDLSPKGSAGSAENLRALHEGGVDFAIVYAGDAYLGRNGMLPGDSTRYDDVRALAYLYGAPAQLVVRADAGITSAMQLAGKAVAVGNPGSGAALSAQRFFSHLNLWSNMEHRNQGYSQAAADFAAGTIDAFWVLAGYPNSSVIEAASRVPISLVPVGNDAAATEMYAPLPYYTPATIPAGTYQNQFDSVPTFQDAALLCAHEDTDTQAVLDTLATIFSERGLASMVNAHRAARDMSVERGVAGVSIPLHPGAKTFWEERGIKLPAP